MKNAFLAATMLAALALPAAASSIAQQEDRGPATDCATVQRVPGTKNWRATGHMEIRLSRPIPDGPLRGLPDNLVIEIDPERFPDAAAFGPDAEIDAEAWCVGSGIAVQRTACIPGTIRLSQVGDGREYGHLFRARKNRDIREQLALAAEFIAARCLTKQQ